MSKKQNQNHTNQQYYLNIDGEQIPVSEEVYRAVKRPEWAEHKRREREKKCRSEHGRRCTGNCEECPFYMDGRNGGTVSLDQLAADGYDVPAVDDVADAVMYAILLDRLYEELDQLCPTDRLIMRLFSLGMSEREISAALKQRATMDPAIKALSQKSVNLHKLSLFDLLRERLKDYR